ncbi:serine/threonine-protein kinase PLK4 [Crotalus adamanteus]|uniref:Serine/threonine-protein kinase PLK4 n=1 Tax=Crotalus adamanteus TaxID=8729 RepID=A0AAW1B9T2_CROAD
MATCIGEKIEDYKVGNLLGKGSFAGVYRAVSLKTGLEVAIKMIDKKAMHKAGMVQRVQNEVKIHCQLKHPSILELYNYFEDSNYVYLILEMCHNGEMSRYLKNRKNHFSEEEVRNFMHQIITGMLYLHSHGILHRDLTLSNLLLTNNMNIKIADFGLATQLKMPHEKHYTMCGTPNYISPEIATRSAHGLESDVWSLGSVFKEDFPTNCDSVEKHFPPSIKEQPCSEFPCPMKADNAFLDRKTQTETMQQWLGNIQLGVQVSEPSYKINGDCQFYLGMPQEALNTARNGSQSKNSPDSAATVGPQELRKFTTRPPCKSEKALLAPAFGLHLVSEIKNRDKASQYQHQKPLLRNIVSPLSAHRLKPIRQKTKNAVVSILDTGEVCMEFLKECNSQEFVKEVLKISCDGNEVTVYHPNEGLGVPLNDRPPASPEHLNVYSLDNLPEKYWKKYQYAAKFVQLVRSKTPKVTFYTRYAKCMLMENSVPADVEICFYDGAKIHKAAGAIRIIEKSGKAYTIKEENENLQKDIQIYVHHANEAHRICLALETAILAEERSESVPFFPIIVGRKPGNPESPKALSNIAPSLMSIALKRDVAKSESSTQASNINLSMCYEGSAFTEATVESKSSSSSSNDRVPHSAQLLKSVFVKNVGWASQLTSGAVWVQFNDGSQLVAQAGVSSITYTSPAGDTVRYKEDEKLPEFIKEKLHCLSSILVMFTNPVGPH